MDYLKVFPVVAASSALFIGVNWLTGTELLRRPAKIQRSPRHVWTWRNTLVSFIHSCITGIWALYCFYDEPEMLTDMVDTWSSISYSMLVFSSGYFIYDFFDVYINFKFFKQWDIIIHHVVVVASLQFAIYTEKQCGSATCSFLMEVNSIFLHARTLLRMSEKNNSSWYSANGVFLLGTFVCFRLMTSAWLVKWSVMNRHILPTVHFAVPFSFGVLLTILNIRLFYRLWNSEFQGRNLNKEKVS